MHVPVPAVLALALLCALPQPIAAQNTPIRPAHTEPVALDPVTLAPNLLKLSGHDAFSGLDYTRILLFGGSNPGDTSAGATTSAPDLAAPTLTGQCTRDAAGKLHFELFANFGQVADPAFYPPWHSIDENDRFPPRTDKVTVTLEFLGYTRVKPYRRVFERVQAPGPAQLRYLNPGTASPNLEQPGWFFGYLRSLPTLRLSAEGHTADFPTTIWLAALRADPLCAASGA